MTPPLQIDDDVKEAARRIVNSQEFVSCHIVEQSIQTLLNTRLNEKDEQRKLVQTLSATGIIKSKLDAGIFIPEADAYVGGGVALLGIRINRSTLEQLSGERVLITIRKAKP